jgi:predicted transcriptional regulator
MLTGRQLYLLRIKDTDISDSQLAEMLGISINDILIYEYGIKEIPAEIYEKWKSILFD